MQVSVIIPDKTIVVDGEALQFDFQSFPPGLRAVQWAGVSGKMEFNTGADQWFDNIAIVQPYVDAWQAEKDRLANEVNA